VAPVRDKGFDHTVQGLYAVAAAVGKVMNFDEEQLINAIAIAGTAFNALRVTRTGSLSHWKGMAYPNAAFCGIHAAFLAKQGITGPRQVFEGNKGFMDSISGRFEIDWENENLEKVTNTITKKFNAEIHSQSTLEGVMDLREEHHIDAAEVERIDLETFDVAYHIIGGGEEGDKTKVTRKEEADHSLHYMIAAALLDGHVMPEQYRKERIRASDIQQLLRKVYVREADDLSERFPREMPIRLAITTQGGKSYSIEKSDYEGFSTRPAKWDAVVNKFSRLTYNKISESDRERLQTVVKTLDERPVYELVKSLQELNLRGTL
ncbi:MAG TPA: MmgE/PrpD family protein, partial [Balneolales bacterium]|nr:MmgE/PrpD family protein [Balneolales bacterium]